MQKLVVVLSLAVVGLTSIACSGETPPPPPAVAAALSPAPPAPAPTPVAAVAAPAAGDPVAEAEALFTARCVMCHGATGKGDGVAAAAMTPKPRDYADKAWQAATKDEDIAKAIVEGGVAIGKSPLMPPNADLKDKAEVVKALVAKIRSFGK